MSSKKYVVPENGSDAYLTYSVQDSPDVTVRDWYNQNGKSYTLWRKWTAYNPPEYQSWKAQQLQDYQNYLDAYNANYNSELSKRRRLEASGFSGQYLANGIGGSASPSPSQVSPALMEQGETTRSKGLGRVLESLQLMSAAGIAMKNFGEGKAAMKYAMSDRHYGNLLSQYKVISEGWKGKGLEESYLQKLAEQADPTTYGYSWDEDKHRYVFDSQGGKYARNPYLEKKFADLTSTDIGNLLKEQQTWLNTLTYDNRKLYEAETMKARKELLENQRDISAIQKEYEEALKAMGVASPILQVLLKLL